MNQDRFSAEWSDSADAGPQAVSIYSFQMDGAGNVTVGPGRPANRAALQLVATADGRSAWQIQPVIVPELPEATVVLIGTTIKVSPPINLGA